jgi:hypothetical protein
MKKLLLVFVTCLLPACGGVPVVQTTTPDGYELSAKFDICEAANLFGECIKWRYGSGWLRMRSHPDGMIPKPAAEGESASKPAAKPVIVSP